MKRLKVILCFSFVFVVLLKVFLYFNYDINNSLYNDNDTNIEGIIDSFYYKNDKTIMEIKAKERILVTFEGMLDNISVGDTLSVVGNFKIINDNRNFNLFNYRKYLLSKGINKSFLGSEIKIINNNKSFIYKIRDYIYKRLNSINNNYLYIFIIGNNKYFDDNLLDTFSMLGISHLFSISGMHISIFSGIILVILKLLHINNKVSYFITSFILIIYLFIIGFSPSIVRSVLLFVVLSFKKIFNLKIKSYEIILILFLVSLYNNPYYLYNSGFLFTYVISFSLIIFSKKISHKNYFINSFNISLLSSLVSLPIVINSYHEINILTPVINVFIVPLVSIVLFPISLIVFIFPSLISIYNLLINIFEYIILFFNNFNFCILVMKHMNIFIIIVYYLFLVIILLKFKFNYYNYILFIIFIILYSNQNIISNKLYMTLIDVGQGDSILISLPYNKGNILIDTGGYRGSNIVINNTIPYLKSEGISKIDYLILSHGDYDHMGESINLVNNFKVSKVLMNSSNNNELEFSLIDVLNNLNIDYEFINKKKFNIDKYSFNLISYYSDEENDNSLILYTNLNNKHILLMGDASSEVENKLIHEYSINNMDILKVGHHGSKTSSSIDFLDVVRPKYSFISVGNNYYGHPNKSVLINLYNIKSNVFDTKTYGSIKILLKDDILIKTCL